jgi:hypothetical protein
MPTLEDTSVDFPVTTLSDLLEADAKAGIAVGADEDKFRRWAILSTAAAGLLAVLLVVSLVTGSGGKESSASSGDVKAYPGRQLLNVRLQSVTPDIKQDAKVIVYGPDGAPVTNDAIVARVNLPKPPDNYVTSVDLALTPSQYGLVKKAFPKESTKGSVGLDLGGGGEPTTTPSSSTPDTTPASTTPETAPVSTPPPSS